MAKTKPGKKPSVKNDPKSSAASTINTQPTRTPPELLAQAVSALQQGDLDSAVPLAQRALGLVDIESASALPALSLLGEIHVELGDIEAARAYFEQAASIDEDGNIEEELGGGAEKFLWLAQLSEEGGRDSVVWFERGASVLRAQIQKLLNDSSKRGAAVQQIEMVVEEKRRKLATALCGIVEVYMTDLSWEDDAEARCESLVTEATLVGPGFAEPWQTLASVRISQERLEDARAGLKRSMEVWKELPPEDESVPDYPTRVSLARLLMEAEMEDEAIEVLERLVGEDDTSIEVWYLGGWGLYVIGEKQKAAGGEPYKVSWISSRQWLNNSMRLFALQDYEDDRLGQHANELITLLDADLGGPATGEEDDEESEWDGIEEDEEMVDA